MNLNWWAITVISFWICGTISSRFTKDDDLGYSLIATILLGIFYLIVRRVT